MSKEKLGLNDKQKIYDLIAKAADGDESAFGQIYDVYFEKVYRFVYYRVSHKETAEDLTGEIFIKIWENIGTLKKVKAFNGWLFQTARNRVIDHYRTKKTEIDIDELENLLKYEDRVIKKIDLDLQQAECIEAMKELSTDQSQIIKLKFFEGLENSEIAEMLNKTEGTIRVAQHRAIENLKNIIQSRKNGK